MTNRERVQENSRRKRRTVQRNGNKRILLLQQIFAERAKIAEKQTPSS